MTALVDLTGQRFGRLLVVERVERSAGSGQARWRCNCDCGGTTVTHGSNLRSGKTTSCGCAVVDANRERLMTHGTSRGDTKHDLYDTWSGIRKRCLTTTSQAYPRYGGRGITVCPEWDDFLTFVADVGPRPSALHSLDRIDNDGNYEPGNVRWATAKEQADNRGPMARLRRENAELVAEVERLRGVLTRTDEADGSVIDILVAERDALRAQRDAVLGLHKPSAETFTGWRDGPRGGRRTQKYTYRVCIGEEAADEYPTEWPCATARALGVTE